MAVDRQVVQAQKGKEVSVPKGKAALNKAVDQVVKQAN